MDQKRPSSKRPPYFRRQFVVDRDYQYRFATRIFLLVLAVAILSALLASLVLWANLPQRVLLRPYLLAIAITLLLELLIAIPITFHVGIRQSLQIIGPVQRIKRTVWAIGMGDFTRRIQVRKGDVLEDVAQSINQMAANLEQRSSSLSDKSKKP